MIFNERFLNTFQNIAGSAVSSCTLSNLLQSVVGLRDLGQFRRQPFEDSTGSVIFVAVRHITDAKNVNKNVYVRWTTLNKLQPSLSLGLAYDSDTSAFDIVAAAVKVSSPAVCDTIRWQPQKNLNYLVTPCYKHVSVFIAFCLNRLTSRPTESLRGGATGATPCPRGPRRAHC